MQSQQLPWPPLVKDVTVGDIPKKYFSPVDDIGVSPFCIHADFKHFRLARSLNKSLPESAAQGYLDKISTLFTKDPSNEKVLVTLSVRSAWDLYFQSKKFPPGSEVLMTGLNIPDMSRIITEHGCVPIPIDLDLDTMSPPIDQVKAALSDKTVAMIFAQVMGVTYDLAPYAEILKPLNVDIIEDLAQSFRSVYVSNG